jgi:8-oxo-dGTP pyrophosphatase MutT (NUDIX family)
MLSGRAAIAGIGATEFSKNSGRSELQLAAEAVRAALADAGLAPSDVDGLVTFSMDSNAEVAVAREIEEECGLEVEIDERPIDVYVAKRNADPMLVIVYRAEWIAGEVRRSEEHDDHAWWTPEEFRRQSTLTRLADAVDRAVQR